MVKTLLNVVQQVAGELAQNVPSAVLSSTNRSVQQLRFLVVAACDELADMHNWQRLLKRGTITTTGGIAEYTLPVDCLRVIPSTIYDHTNTRGVAGNSTAETWAYLNNQVPGPDTRFRVIGNKIVLFPTPGGTQKTITFDYITRNYVYDVGLAALKPEFTLDSDQTAFHDRLLINFTKLKFLQEQGLNTQAATENFNSALTAAKAGDTPAQIIDVSGGSYGDHFIDASNTAPTNWGQ